VLVLATLARGETANMDFGDAYLAAEAVASDAGVTSFHEDFGLVCRRSLASPRVIAVRN
jgi:hypothetical protein